MCIRDRVSTQSTGNLGHMSEKQAGRSSSSPVAPGSFLERQNTHQAAAKARRRQLASKHYSDCTHQPRLSTRPGSSRATNQTVRAPATVPAMPTKVKCTSSSVAHTLGTLRTCQATSLDMSGCAIGDAGATRLAKALRGGSSITSLSLASNNLSSKAVSEVVLGLQGQLVRGVGSVVHLNLSNNTLGGLLSTEPPAVVALASLLRRDDCVLQKLNLGNSSLQPMQVCALATAIRSNHSLKTLELRGNKTHCSGARALAEACTVNSTLTSLQLCGNQLTDEGAAWLFKLLPTATALTQLNLGSNGLSDKAMLHCAQLLANPECCLRELGLSDNKISSKGAAVLGRGINANTGTGLRELQLNDNHISDAGAVALSTAVPRLERLKVAGCGVLEAGGVALAQAAGCCESGIQLWLARNPLGARSKRWLLDVCARRSWSWDKERVLWCGSHSESVERFGGLPPEVMIKLVGLCRVDGAMFSTQVTVDLGQLVVAGCPLGIHRAGGCKCAPPKPDFYK
eukprot:TRINITY_DN6387_c0_g1_i2.p1 TRINITY_DN6387_c0_g1~~TRINITY_DN6387_c0_g1_i2.p1  ORF type:complete len:513 (+),score=93.43 TRINITY_DN6387_c0_g1_i2:199-1737(+)